MRLIFWSTLFSIIVSCSNGTNSANNKTDSESSLDSLEKRSPKTQLYFTSVYDSLPELDLPVKWNDQTWRVLTSKFRDRFGESDDDRELLKHPYAKLVDSKLYKAIIFISTTELGSPIIVTIDKNEKPIDSLPLMDHWIGAVDYRLQQSAEIKPNLSIQLVDSTFEWELDKEENKIEKSKILTSVKKEEYRILDNGQFEKRADAPAKKVE